MTPQIPIYLDYNSSTPVDKRVLEEMLPYFNEKFGNAASKTHSFGWVAEEAVEHARKQIAQLINAEPTEIIFTSGATEGINLAIKGIFETYKIKGNHIITVATEHKAVIDTCRKMEKQGAEISFLPVDPEGILDLGVLEKAITAKTILISVMYANNEIGVLQPVKAIAEIAHNHNVIFMSDATQAIGKIDVDVQELGLNIMPLSAHKSYGPKGIGALFIRRKNPRVKLASQIEGGGHERGLRSGTLNVPGIVGLGKACDLALRELDEDRQRILRLREKLQIGLSILQGVSLNGSEEHRLPNTVNVSFENVDSHLLMKKLSNRIAVASGSACTSALMEPSYVLKALGLDDDTAYSSIRFSLGKFTTEEEIDFAIDQVKEEITQLRKLKVVS